MIDIENIYSRYYSENRALLDIVSTHSECVTRKAVSCARASGLDIDTDFVFEAAMLHDIGVVMCDAPSIMCFGSLPYICHGIAGKEILENAGLPRHALVCERHTGAGITAEDILRQNLPLPPRDMLPISLEEKVICYADKFFSKSGDISREKKLEKVMAQMQSHGEESLKRFLALHELFGK